MIANAMSSPFCILISLINYAFTTAKVTKAPLVKLNDGRDMPTLALGTWLGADTESHLESANNEVEQAVSWAIEAGYRHIDTASFYQVEKQVGAAIKKLGANVSREELFVTTKLWNDQHARDAVVPALRTSLRKLQLEYLDLYLIHWPGGQFANKSFDLTDYLETWQGMMEAKRLGLARSIGVSNFNQQMLERIQEHGLEKPAVLQVEINLSLQQPALLSYCRSQNITVAGYTPFGSLFPSKAREDAPPPRVDDEVLVRMARSYNKTVPQIALRYLVELGVVPIPKSTTKSRIEVNIDIFDFALTKDDQEVLKSFDRGYRIFTWLDWRDHPYYPFEKN